MHTVGVTLLHYVASRRAAQEIGPASAYRYRLILLGFAQAIGLGLPLARLNRHHIEKWFQARHTAGIAQSTLSFEFNIVRGYCRWAVDMKYLNRSPCDGIKGPRRPESRPRSMGADDVGRVLEACPDARARLICMFMVQLGMRCCEVARLETGELDLRDNLILAHGKGNRDRWLPIPEEAMAALRDYLAEYPPVAGPLIRSYQPPFRGLSPGRIGDIVRIAMTDSGVKTGRGDGKSAHAFRHTFASDLVEGGVDIENVRQALGHASLQTTSIYTKKQGATVRLREAMEGRTYGATP